MCLTTGVSFAIICVLCCSLFLLVIMFIKKKRPRFLYLNIAFFCICFIYLDCLYLLFGPASCCCFSVARTIVGTWPFFFSIGAEVEGGRRRRKAEGAPGRRAQGADRSRGRSRGRRGHAPCRVAWCAGRVPIAKSCLAKLNA